MKDIDTDIHADAQPQQKQDSLAISTNHRQVFRALLLQRWAAILGTISLGVLYLFISPRLQVPYIPTWLPLTLETVLLLPFAYALIMHRQLPHSLLRMLGIMLAAIATITNIISVGLLLKILLFGGKTTGSSLVRDAAILWISNVLVFGLWYWELDGGGPLKRHLRNHKAIDFMFPQQVDGDTNGWAPHFIDYIFLAFNTATAFSPTDTAPLSRQAKVLMMIESLISLVIIAVIAARAVNILGN